MVRDTRAMALKIVSLGIQSYFAIAGCKSSFDFVDVEKACIGITLPIVYGELKGKARCLFGKDVLVKRLNGFDGIDAGCFCSISNGP